MPDRSCRFDAVLFIAFGGPGGLADIRPFLQNVLRGRRVTAERIEEVARHYERFGGVSPITELTRQQAAGLQRRLDAIGLSLSVHVGMRNWHPFLADTLETMSKAGIRSALGFVAAAYRSEASCGLYRQNVAAARRELSTRRVRDVEVIFANDDWHTHPGFIEANADAVRDALLRLPPDLQARARIVFTAHSIPVAMARTSRYVSQLEESARTVAEATGRSDWALVYQSRSGRPEDPWLEPDVGEYLKRERAAGLEAVVICPIGFLCDHVEVLYDLDHEAAALCHQIGLPMTRAAAVNTHPAFLDALADVVRTVLERYRGRPLPIVGAVPE